MKWNRSLIVYVWWEELMRFMNIEVSLLHTTWHFLISDWQMRHFYKNWIYLNALRNFFFLSFLSLYSETSWRRIVLRVLPIDAMILYWKLSCLAGFSFQLWKFFICWSFLLKKFHCECLKVSSVFLLRNFAAFFMFHWVQQETSKRNRFRTFMMFICLYYIHGLNLYWIRFYWFPLEWFNIYIF